MLMVSRKGEELPANFSQQVFPPPLTHDVPVSAGEALRACDAGENRLITGQMLEKVRMRAGMTSEQVGAMGYGLGMRVA